MMTLVENSKALPTRRGKRDQDWSRLCDNVFDQYLSSDDIFDTNNNHHDDKFSLNAQDKFLAISADGQAQGDANGTTLFWESAAAEVEAKQPKPRESAGFLSNTLTTWQKNAAEDEAKREFSMETKHDCTGASGLSRSVESWSWTGSNKPGSGLTSLARNSMSPEDSTVQHSPPHAFQPGSREQPHNMRMMSDVSWNNDVMSSFASSMDVSQLHSSSVSPALNTPPPTNYPQHHKLGGTGLRSRPLAPRSVPADNIYNYSQSLPLSHSPMPEFSCPSSPMPQSWSPSVMSGSSIVGTPLNTYRLDDCASPFFTDKPGSVDSLGISYNTSNNPWATQPGTPQSSSPYLQAPRTFAPMLNRATSNCSTSTRGGSRSTRLNAQRSSSNLRRPRRSKSTLSSKSTRSRELSPGSCSTTASSAAPAEEGGFVNYTPQDGKTILGGVAPSGSSKTKARREREAAEKRRRFNQVAVRAVVEAGGDLSALSQAGIVI